MQILNANRLMQAELGRFGEGLGFPWESPILTTINNTPSPYVPSASSDAGSSYEAWRAMDESSTTRWSNNSVASAGSWWKLYVGTIPVSVTSITIKQEVDRGFNGFKLQGSTNDSDWTDVYEDNCANNTDVQSFSFSNSAEYNYYRLYCVSGYSASWLQLFNVTMSGTSAESRPIILLGIDFGTTGVLSTGKIHYGREKGLGTQTSLTAKIYSLSNTNIRFAIYSEKAGPLPDSLLGETGSLAVTASTWNEITIPSISIVKDSYYWTAVQIEGADGCTWYSGEDGRSENQAYGAFPASATSDTYTATTPRVGVWGAT